MAGKAEMIPGGEGKAPHYGGKRMIFVVEIVRVRCFAGHAILIEIWAPKSKLRLQRDLGIKRGLGLGIEYGFGFTCLQMKYVPKDRRI